MDQNTALTILGLGLPVAYQAGKSASVVAEDFLKRLLGPLADEKSRRWVEKMKKTVEDAAHLVDEAGIEGTAVPPRVLIPLMQAAAVEDDDTLSSNWTTLLANAADPENLRKVTPSFVSILKDLSPAEAVILRTVYTMTTANMSFVDPDKAVLRLPNQPDGSTLEIPVPYGDFNALADNLQRLGLTQMMFGGQTRSGASLFTKVYKDLSLTPLGRSFVAACTRVPKDRGQS